MRLHPDRSQSSFSHRRLDTTERTWTWPSRQRKNNSVPKSGSSWTRTSPRSCGRPGVCRPACTAITRQVCGGRRSCTGRDGPRRLGRSNTAGSRGVLPSTTSFRSNRWLQGHLHCRPWEFGWSHMPSSSSAARNRKSSSCPGSSRARCSSVRGTASPSRGLTWPVADVGRCRR